MSIRILGDLISNFVISSRTESSSFILFTLSPKSVFFIMYIGQFMTRRLEKMTDFMKATRYEVPALPEECDREVARLSRSITESEAVVNHTKEAVANLLSTLTYESENKMVLLSFFFALSQSFAFVCTHFFFLL